MKLLILAAWPAAQPPPPARAGSASPPRSPSSSAARTSPMRTAGCPTSSRGDITKRSKLLLQTPEGFDSRYGVKVLVETEALEIDRAGKRVRVKGPEGESWLGYDSLILAQGGTPVMPPVPGIDSPNVFRLWTVPDMDRIIGVHRGEGTGLRRHRRRRIHRHGDGGGLRPARHLHDYRRAPSTGDVDHGPRVRRT